MAIGQKITPFLWFDNNAEEAVGFYTSISGTRASSPARAAATPGRGRKGSILAIAFKLEGQDFVALNGGPHFKFSEAISLYVNCETQEEIEQFWSKLAAGGEEHDCGWLKDRYGLSWQVNYAGDPGHDERQPPRSCRQGHAGHAQDEEDRHPAAEGRLRGALAGGPAPNSR